MWTVTTTLEGGMIDTMGMNYNGHANNTHKNGWQTGKEGKWGEKTSDKNRYKVAEEDTMIRLLASTYHHVKEQAGGRGR